MAVRVFNKDLYVGDEEIADAAREVIYAIKKKLPKEHHCECVISEILSEVKNIIASTTLNL